MWRHCVFISVIYFRIFFTHAHVALVFPPARKFDLDFLDTVRTEKPCGGMPKGDIKTTIPNNGEKLKVEWHLGYSHKGGFKLELLDSQENHLLDLTEFISVDEYSVNYEIDIPSSLNCKGCVLRLVRQAKEWGGSYQFMSCADVDIISDSEYQVDCLGNGTPNGDSCQCDKNHFGDRCQFFQDCADNSDCQNNGLCRDNAGTSFPKKECYCPLGFYGRNCEKESSLKNQNYTISEYESKNFKNGNFKFLWKYIGDNLEGIIIAKTMSYVAIGWRNVNTNPSCQNFPTGVKSPVRAKQLHSMDCQDIVMGKAYQSYSHVGDYYTRDRSTPRRDVVYGGQDDLIAAAGWEEDGITTIMFRKPVYAGHKTDNSFRGEILFIYAFGQDGLDFYAEDEFKYHGRSNRGSDVFSGCTTPQQFNPLLLLALVFFFFHCYIAI